MNRNGTILKKKLLSLNQSNIEFIKIYNSLYRTLTAKIKQAAAKPSGIDDYGAIAWFA